MFKKTRKIWLLVIMLIFMLTVEVVNNQVLSMTYKKYEIENVSEENYSEGLLLELDYDETGYVLRGIGTCTDSVVIIPSTYKGLPVHTIESMGSENVKNITEIIVPNCVTRIGQYAFYSCSNLVSITIPFVGESLDSEYTNFGYIFGTTTYDRNGDYLPDTLKNVKITGGDKIDNHAFYGCLNLETIEIPDSVTSIGSYAFGYCKSLINIEIPSGVNKIDDYAFKFCEKLTTINIPQNVPKIGCCALEGCTSLQNIVFEEGSMVSSIDTYAFSGCTNLQNINIPNGVTIIDNGAFRNCVSLESVIIEEDSKLRSIVDYAFENCTSLKSIIIPDSVANIGGSVFENCTNLEYVKLPKNLAAAKPNLFFNCISLKEVVMPNNIQEIYDEVFSGCSSLTKIDLPSSITSIDSYAFNGCTSLKSITIPKGITTIERNLFSECINLEEVKFEEDSQLKVINQHAFYNCSKLTNIDIPNTVTYIGTYAFSGCASLKSVTIPDGVTIVEKHTFSNCTNLQDIIVPKDITKIYDYTFSNCTMLENVYYKGTIEDWCDMFFYADTASPMYYAKHFYMLNEYDEWYEVTDIIIPDGTYSIRGYQFYGFRNLKTIFIPISVEIVAENAFKDCANLTIYCERESKSSNWYSNWNPDNLPVVWGWKNVEYSEGLEYTLNDEKTGYIVTGIGTCEDTEIIIPNTYEGLPVVSIGESSFSNCSSLISIEIPNSVTSIGESAFSNCTSLEEVFFEENSQLTSIESEVFINCYNLTTIKIPNSVTSIGAGAFYCCTSLKEVIFEENSQLTSIGNSAFQKCISLESIEIPNSVTSIPDSAFSNCESLTNITIPDSVTSIGAFSFDHCVSLTNINVDPNNEYYKSIDGVLYSKDEKTLIRYPEGKEDSSFIVPNSVTRVGDCSFPYCESLTSIEIPNSVTSIGNCAFFECINLTSIVIPDSVTFIGADVFHLCYELMNINVDPNNEYYKSIDGVLYSKDGKTLIQYPIGKEDTSFVIPSGVTNIDWNAFYNCLSLTSVEIPNGVTSIGYDAFGNCSNLTKIVIPNSVTYMDIAFYGCERLTIYCEVESKPSGWDEYWNSDNLPVVWGYKKYSEGLEYEWFNNGYQVIGSGTCTDEDIVIPETYEGYDIIGLIFNFPNAKTVTIPNTIQLINNGVFFDNSNLTNIITYEDNPYWLAIDGILYNKDGSMLVAYPAGETATSFEIPEHVKRIHSLMGNNHLEEVIISANVEVIDTLALYNCENLENIQVSEDNPNYKSLDGNLYTKDMTTLVQYAVGKEELSFSVPESVIIIGESSIENSKLEKVILPKGLEIIDVCAFENCVNLKSVIIPNTVTTIGLQAFKKCESLEKIIIPFDVTEIGKNAFDGCRNLTIKCEVESKPSGWDEHWNSTNCPVEWGYVKPAYILGDLDKDELVNTNDVIYLLMHTYFADSYPVEQDCDYDNSESIDTNDVIYLLMHTYFADSYPLE